MTERDFIENYGSILSDEDDLMHMEDFHTNLLMTLKHFMNEIEGKYIGEPTLKDFVFWLDKKTNE